MKRTHLAILVMPLVPRGGVFDILRNWLLTLNREKFDVTVLYCCHPQYASTVQRELAEIPQLKVYALTTMRLRFLLLLPNIWEVYKYLRAEKIDIIHTMLLQSDIVGSVAGRLAGVKGTVSSVVGRLMVPRGMALLKNGYYRLAYAVAKRWIDRFIAISGETRRDLIEDCGVHPSKVETVYCGINLSRFEGPFRPAQAAGEDGNLVVGSAAELIPEKGMEYVVRTAAVLLRNYPRLQFVIAGDGPERGRLVDLVRDFHLESAVTLVGWIADIRSFLAGCHIFVFPSLPNYDGLPRVVLEAWAAGVPLVATRVAGVTEVVRDHIDGILVPPGDVASLSQGIAELLRDPALRGAVQREGLRSVRGYSREQEVAILESIYAVYA